MMEYGWDPTKFSLPQQEGVRRWVMKLGENTIEETKAMFAVSFFMSLTISLYWIPSQTLTSKISLSLDAWTSSNYHAFLAIVAHFVTDDGYCGKFESQIETSFVNVCW